MPGALSDVLVIDLTRVMLTIVLRTRSTCDWIGALLSAEVPCGPVNDIPAALNDPHVQARMMVQTVEHATGGKIPLVGPVPKFSATPAQITAAPPLLGEHTDLVLKELLGYDGARILALRAEGTL
jgi:crotonobetainyl-CoA:carnitine CoA-transferase CaiB-like acyl-CoA transferase